MARGIMMGIGIIFLIIAVAFYTTPISVTLAGTTVNLTIPKVVAFCDSGLGQFAQMPPQVVMVCSEYNNFLMGIYGSVLLGIILIIVGAVVSGKKEALSVSEKKEAHSDLEEKYTKGELSKGEFKSKKEKIDEEQVNTNIEILKERYAKGEITKEEFENMKKDLE